MQLQAVDVFLPVKVFFYELWDIFRNNYFAEHLQMTASEQGLGKNSKDINFIYK